MIFFLFFVFFFTKSKTLCLFKKGSDLFLVIDIQTSDMFVISPSSHLGVVVLVLFLPCVYECVCLLIFFIF